MPPIVISQPTFLPWLGYFDLIDQASQFVFLDQVQFAKRSWQQRNQILTAQGLKWVTVPVLVAGRRDQSISDVEISTTADFPRKMLRMIEQEYRKAPHFDNYFPAFESTVENAAPRGLASLNIELIELFVGFLGIDTPMTIGSTLGVPGNRSDLLAGISQAMDADRYLSARGAADYLVDDADVFAAAGIVVELQSYEHPEYPQLHPGFSPYASVVDLLLNVGSDSLDVIRSGRRANTRLEDMA